MQISPDQSEPPCLRINLDYLTRLTEFNVKQILSLKGCLVMDHKLLSGNLSKKKSWKLLFLYLFLQMP